MGRAKKTLEIVGVVLGTYWMLPMGILGSLLFLTAVACGMVGPFVWRYRYATIVVLRGRFAARMLAKGWAATTVGEHVFCYSDPFADPEQRILKHEWRHVWQQMVFGIFQPMVYGVHWLYLRTVKRLPSREAYRQVCWERDARRYAGE
jgi:hypothetical protein